MFLCAIITNAHYGMLCMNNYEQLGTLWYAMCEHHATCTTTGAQVYVFVNSLGGSTHMELLVSVKEVVQQLQALKVDICVPKSTGLVPLCVDGNYM